ncbi:MAG: hypothetical protein HY703_06150 [Gemmatimonadetes bacterium]|nr:hypothetical protein [Gemmatimonadota bacterium]
MSDLIFQAHSGLRYLVLLAAAAMVVYALQGWMRRQPYDRAAALLGRGFLGLLDVQLLLGILLLFLRPLYPALSGHVSLMLLAAAAAHGASIANRRRPAEQKSFALALAGSAGALLLLMAGILAIGRAVV